eukprot:403346317
MSQINDQTMNGMLRKNENEQSDHIQAFFKQEYDQTSVNGFQQLSINTKLHRLQEQTDYEESKMYNLESILNDEVDNDNLIYKENEIQINQEYQQQEMQQNEKRFIKISAKQSQSKSGSINNKDNSKNQELQTATLNQVGDIQDDDQNDFDQLHLQENSKKRVSLCSKICELSEAIMNQNKQVKKKRMQYINQKMIMIHPDNIFKFYFDIIVDLAYVTSFFLIPIVQIYSLLLTSYFRICFQIEPLQSIFKFELIIDTIITMNIFSNFITSSYVNGKLTKKLGVNAKNYITGHFLFDCMGVLPGLISQENIPDLYYFKIVRYLHVNILFKKINEILKRVQKILIHNQNVENYFIIFRTLLYFTIYLHFMTCMWILFSYSENSWIDDYMKFQELDSNNIQSDYTYMYWTSFYFITTTATTVGFGEICPTHTSEKAYLIFLEFTAICSFSIITSKILSLKWTQSLTTIIQEKQDAIESYLGKIDKNCKRNMSNYTYDQAQEFIKISYLKGLELQFKKNKYYKILPPNLREKLAQTVLGDYEIKFQCFFHDSESNIKAHHNFVVVKKEAEKSAFLTKFVHADFNTQSDETFHKKQKQSEDEIIAYLPDGSFFGDYQILFNLPSNFDFHSNGQETILMTISDKKFHKSCQNFPRFHNFLYEKQSYFFSQKRIIDQLAQPSVERQQIEYVGVVSIQLIK